MSKRAEQAALKAYPEKWFRDIDGDSYDTNRRERITFTEAYEQAEKDLALTADDIARISGILCNVYEEAPPGNPQTFYKEVLRRFNEWREKK